MNKKPLLNVLSNLNLANSKNKLSRCLPLLGVSVVLLGSCTPASRFLSSPQRSEPRSEQGLGSASNVTSSRPLTPTAEDTNFVVEVVERVEPAVVQIDTAQRVRSQVPNALNDPFLQEFFGGQPAVPRERVIRGSGSGFVISADGQILTNAHVVNKADVVTVSFPGGESFEGKVLGADPVTDIAVVKIPATNLPTVELGSSKNVRPGQWAIAIGNPLGLQETVTLGVVSATDRSASDIGVSDKRIGFIQTDAAINPGNSGGPLLNARGQVIGINTAIIGGAQGIGFAIPIDTAQQIAQTLITQGRVLHPYLGVQLAALTPEVREKLESRNIQIPAQQGILILQVVPNSPADKAGIQPGDVLQQINNQPITKPEEVQSLVEQSGVGQPLPIQLQRGDRSLQVSVVPEPLPAPTE
ncbi:MAG: trypsin-like peptidase domain-containing protein [Trichocoleus desertorum ATA4-8-CV12]|jgi:S1-C subfamily serine protease|nr:trypsin-like peptidase domain-containing protein [Trichocoleus desertorum ATA4-8-CV12]